MNAMSWLRIAVVVVLAATAGMISNAAEVACYQINTTQECPQEAPPNPNTECNSECPYPWVKQGPTWETYVTQKTLLLTPGASGFTCVTRKCRRVYTCTREGYEDRVCFGPGYGTVSHSFTENSCVVGSGSGS